MIIKLKKNLIFWGKVEVVIVQNVEIKQNFSNISKNYIQILKFHNKKIKDAKKKKKLQQFI